MSSIPFKGLLFDLDGTLVDSIPAVTRAWSKWAIEKGLEPEYVLSRIHGRPAVDSITELLGNASAEQIEQEFKWLEDYESTDTQGTVALDGAVNLLHGLNELDVPWAIVTSGTLPVATARIRAAGLPLPKVLITPEKLQNGKPHPEPFLTGASELGLDAADCVCFEDAKAGVISAKQASSTVVAVLSHATKEDLPEADYYISSPADVTIASDPELGFSLTV